MLVFKHPKYYEEIRKRAKREQELERKRASERASRREGGPTSHEQGSERASKLNADNSERFVEGARSRAVKRSTER